MQITVRITHHTPVVTRMNPRSKKQLHPNNCIPKARALTSFLLQWWLANFFLNQCLLAWFLCKEKAIFSTKSQLIFMRHLDLIYLIVTACKHVSTALRNNQTWWLGGGEGELKRKIKGLSQYKKHSKVLFSLVEYIKSFKILGWQTASYSLVL